MNHEATCKIKRIIYQDEQLFFHWIEYYIIKSKYNTSQRDTKGQREEINNKSLTMESKVIHENFEKFIGSGETIGGNINLLHNLLYKVNV